MFRMFRMFHMFHMFHMQKDGGGGGGGGGPPALRQTVCGTTVPQHHRTKGPQDHRTTKTTQTQLAATQAEAATKPGPFQTHIAKRV